jgi:hypothetical protein
MRAFGTGLVAAYPRAAGERGNRIGVVIVVRVVALVPVLGVVIATVVAVAGAAMPPPRFPHPRVDPPPKIRPSTASAPPP